MTAVVPNVEVSAILGVYNEEQYLPICLATLAAQSHPTYEIIVVDDSSTDATLEIAQRWQEQIPNLTVLQQPHSGWTYARNLGANRAAGEIVVFLDGDMAFHPDFLTRLIAPIKEQDRMGTFSKQEYVANYHNVWARCWSLNDGLTSSRRHPDDFPDEHGSYRAVRKDRFLAVGGYEHLGAGSDFSLARKLGCLAVAAPGAVCYHYNPGSLSEAFTQGRWYGRGSRIKTTRRSFVNHSVPVSLLGSLRRAWAYRLPQFIVFKLVFDGGVFVGLTESLVSPKKTGK